MSSRSRDTDPHERVRPLDGLRGIAILLVLLFHTTWVQPGSLLESFLYYSFRNWGWAGVNLFFVLSGFLITGVLQDSKGDSRSSRNPHYFRNFYARRTLRVFPLYYGYLALVLWFAPPLIRHKLRPDFIYFWLYLQNYSVAAAGDFVHTYLLDHFWSLAIEEQFYLVWPLVVLVCGRRRLMTVCVALVVFSLGLRIALLSAGVSTVAIFVLTPTRLDGLAVGAFLAAAARGPAGLTPYVSAARWVAAASALGLAGVTFWQKGLFFYVLPGTSAIGFTLLALLFGSCLVLAVEGRTDTATARILSGRLLGTLGRYSYAMYVFHEVVRVFLAQMARRYGIEPYAPQPGLWLQAGVYVSVIGLTTLLAAASWRFYERPILGLKRFFPTASSAPSAPALMEEVPKTPGQG